MGQGYNSLIGRRWHSGPVARWGLRADFSLRLLFAWLRDYGAQSKSPVRAPRFLVLRRPTPTGPEGFRFVRGDTRGLVGSLRPPGDSLPWCRLPPGSVPSPNAQPERTRPGRVRARLEPEPYIR